ncbi:uncharacterized protein LOC124885580 isoform X1 [Capsicum annuum]|uniref:uncharacterized protein LOC124885580 isoform X1 n=1 Tax=Capsicum annuum TaxID=4072 RepID=UPI001FB108A2|nr:uncharacterized protein LOC124885580 isoform X1 [Capsicum annuum]
MTIFVMLSKNKGLLLEREQLEGNQRKMDPPPHSQTQISNNWRGAKFIWRAVLIFNLGLGVQLSELDNRRASAYLFARPAKKDKKATTRQPITPAETTIPTPLAPHNFEPIFSPIPEPVKVAESLYVERQHSFFGSMLKDKEEGQTSKLRREEDNQ